MAQNNGKEFNWETTKYGKIWYDEDIYDLKSVKTKFPAIAFNDQISSEKHFLVNPRAIRHMALPPRDQRHQYLRVQVFDFRGLPDLMAEGLSARMLMEHRDAQG
ncbi:hypothetical protein Tco_1433018, partial [Tanacetum coccineum]